jgi:serine/threonine protein kinase
MDPPSIDKEYELHKKWVAEARALDHIRGLNHRNIIQRIAAIKRGKEHYFMFEWADGGSLRDFWKDNPRPNLDSGFIKEIVIQLRELADALHELHNYEGSFRHGDLKPENILRFKDATRVGVLKIADMGSVRHHTDLSYTRYGTVRYEPPEVVTHRTSEESSSRLYDIWSMGCITLEFIVWLLYGYHDLMKFNDSIKSFVGGSSPYSKVGNDNVAEVHPVVRACMDDISKDPECTSNGGNIAIRDLLDIVKTNLLVVHLPQHRVSHLASIPGNVAVTDTDSRASSTYPPIRPTRATALHFRTLLDGMIGKGKEDERYWFSGISRENLKGLPTRMIPSIDLHDFLSPESASRPRAKFSEL